MSVLASLSGTLAGRHACAHQHKVAAGLDLFQDKDDDNDAGSDNGDDSDKRDDKANESVLNPRGPAGLCQSRG